jgi:uncharacterized protein
MNDNNIKQMIEKLLIIQERDVRIMRCQREINAIPRRAKEIEDEADHAREALQKAKNESKARQSEVKKAELEIETVRQKIAKLREQQFQIKSNEEFKTLNKEIALLNEDIKKMEEREIACMEQVENAQRDEVKAQKDLALMELTIKDRLQELQDRKASLEKEVQQFLSERDTVAKDVDKDIMPVYNRIMENKKDAALVPAENSTCAGCHMHLQAQVICDLKRAAGLITCSFCGRILYLVH